MFLLLFIFAILGMELFGDQQAFEENLSTFQFLNSRANFNSFGGAVITLLQMATGEYWSGIMRELRAVEPKHAEWFSILFMILFHFTMLNLFLAVVLSSFLINTYDDSLG